MRVWVAVLALSMSCSASAYETGGQILGACGADPGKGVEQFAASMHCSGYITGVMDGLLMLQATLPQEKQFLCVRQTSGQETQLAVVKWLREHPEGLNESARIVVLKAFQANYPCKR